jgi:hypothetical protein
VILAMAAIEEIYDAAARAGLLTAAECAGTVVRVDFRAPDEDVLDGLGVSRGYTIRYPAQRLGLAAGDELTVAGHPYRVRAVRQVGDGSECRATLTRIT